MPLVSITRLRVRSFRYLPAFLVGSLRAARAAKNTTGNLAVCVERCQSRILDAHAVGRRAIDARFHVRARAPPLDAEAFAMVR